MEWGGHRRRGPERRQHPDRLVAQAAQRQLEHAERGRVEPLRVVERDEHRAALGERAQNVEHGQPDRVRIRRSVARLHDQERDLQRPPPRRKERADHLVEDR